MTADDANYQPPPDGAEPAENVSEPEPRPRLGEGPLANWRTIKDEQTQEQVEQNLASLHRDWERPSYAAWVALMHQIPYVRALKNFCGGKVFEAKCKALCKISKTYAHAIVELRLAEPDMLAKIWNWVEEAAFSAEAQGKRYEYPTLGKIIARYKPPPPEKTAPAETTEDDDDDEGSNDPRSKRQLRTELLNQLDNSKKLMQRLMKAERIATDAEDALAKEQESHRAAVTSLTTLRQTVTEQAQVIDTQKAENEQQRAENERLQALLRETPPKPEEPVEQPPQEAPPPGPAEAPIVPPAGPSEEPKSEEPPPGPAEAPIVRPAGPSEEPKSEEPPPGPAEKPEEPIVPEQEEPTPEEPTGPEPKSTVGDVLGKRDDIDPRWKAKMKIGGGRMWDYEHIKAVRIACFDLLDEVESSQTAHAYAAWLNTLDPTFFRQVKLEMTIDAVRALPETPPKG